MSPLTAPPAKSLLRGWTYRRTRRAAPPAANGGGLGWVVARAGERCGSSVGCRQPEPKRRLTGRGADRRACAELRGNVDGLTYEGQSEPASAG